MKQEVNQDDSKIGVYRIITPSGKIYIGMTTTSFKERWKNHNKDLNNGKHKCQGLKYSYNFYSKDWNLFQCEVLKSWDKPNDKEKLKFLQKKILIEEKLAWIRHKNSGYVMIHGCPTGTGSVIHTVETREKIGKASIISNSKRSTRTKFSDDEIKLIKADYESGILMKDLYEKYDKNPKKLYALIKELNLKRPEIDSDRAFKRMLNEYPIINWHFTEGKSAVEISKIVGCSNSYISSLLRYVMKENPKLDNSKALLNIQNKAAEGLRNSKKIKCQYCSREIGITVIKRHENACPSKDN